MEKPSKIHFIALEGDLAVDLAIALEELGQQVTSSCEDLSTLQSSKLLSHKLFPHTAGWFPENITASINAVVIGANTHESNPELKKALQLKIPVKSIPEVILEQTQDKQRLVVIGNNGKTIITLMMVHVLDYHNRKFDFVASASMAGHDHLVRLSDAPTIIIEGQDVMSSAVDPTPQFLKYRHHIGVISGIEWQQSQAYPTREDYTKQFAQFVSSTPKGGVIIYVEFDPVIAVLSKVSRPDILLVPYKAHASSYEGGKEYLLTSQKQLIALKITGKHNLQYVSAAQEALKRIGITSEMFYQAITSFEGARS